MPGSARPLAAAALAALLAHPAPAADPAAADDPAANDARLQAEYWIARCPDPDRLLADAAAIRVLNRRMLAEEPSITDLERLPATLGGDDVVRRITGRGRLPDTPLDFAAGGAVDDDDRRRFRESLAVDAVPPRVEPRFGIVVRRTAVRGFPTRQRVIVRGGDTDIDQLQETAFFPGTPVAALHAAPDGDWWFVIGPTYDGWVAAGSVAFGSRDEVLAFAGRGSRVVTAARAATVFTPDLPGASQVALDMGTTLPERRDWPMATPVNGQSAAGGVVVDLPLRGPDGALRIAAALVPRSADTRDGPLPATRANVLRQAFRFLGERYGWGHDFDGRDCSGFVCDVYRSLGILLPRNTRDQAVCPVLSTTPIAADWPRERRIAALDALLPGDLVFTRRHVMIVIGHDDGPWVIHDTHEGRVAGAGANGVVVQRMRTADAVTALVRVLPSPAPQAP